MESNAEWWRNLPLVERVTIIVCTPAVVVLYGKIAGILMGWTE